MTKNTRVRRALPFVLSGAVASWLWLFGVSGSQAQTSTTEATTTTTTVAATTTTTTRPVTTTTTTRATDGSTTTTTTTIDCGPIDRVVLPDGSQVCAHPEDPGTAGRATATPARVAFTG